MIKPPPQVRTKEEVRRCMSEGIDVSVVAMKGVQTDPLAVGPITGFDEATLTVHVGGSPYALQEHYFYETDPDISPA